MEQDPVAQVKAETLRLVVDYYQVLQMPIRNQVQVLNCDFGAFLARFWAQGNATVLLVENSSLDHWLWYFFFRQHFQEIPVLGDFLSDEVPSFHNLDEISAAEEEYFVELADEG